MKHSYIPDFPQEFRWVETEGGVKITEYLGTKDAVRLPESLDGKPVVAIASNAFFVYRNPRAFLLPATLERIETSDQGYEEHLWSFDFEVDESNPHMKIEGDFLLTADGKTLLRCLDTTGTEITIPDGVTTIASEAFCNCKVKKFHFPESLEVIEDYAFCGCEFQAGIYDKMTLPKGLKKLGRNLAMLMPSDWRKPVNYVVVPKSVTEIGGGAGLVPSGLDQNPNFTMQGDFLLSTDGKQLVMYLGNTEATELEIPEGVEEILSSAMYRAESIKKLTLPTTLRIIRKEAFPENKVKTLRLPAALEVLEDGAYPFEGLTSILLDKKNTHFFCDKTCLYRILEDGKMELLCCFRPKLEEYQIAEGTVRILPDVFTRNELLKNLTLPESLEELNELSFSYMIPLAIPAGVKRFIPHADAGRPVRYDLQNTSVVLVDNHIFYQVTEEGLIALRRENYAVKELVFHPDTVRIADGAFKFGSVEKITLNEGLKYIGEKAFIGNRISSLQIPASVCHIAYNAFEDCPLEEISVAEGSAHYCALDGALYSADQTVLHRVPVKKAYAEFVVPETVKDIRCAFEACEKIKTIRLPSGLKQLWHNAMAGCKKLKDVYFGPALEYVNTSFIDYDFNISLHIEPDSPVLDFLNQLRKQGVNPTLNPVIRGMEKLAKLSKEFTLVPNQTGLTIAGYLGKSRDVTVPEKLGEYTITAIGPGAFAENYGNRFLNSLIIPDTVTEIGNLAFRNCQNLSKLELGKGLKHLGEGAFAYCETLTELTIPEGVEEIGATTFFGCKKLLRLTLPASVRFIHPNVFAASTDGEHRDLYLNTECVYFVTPGSCAETFLNSYVRKTYGKPTPLRVESSAEGSASDIQDDSKYLKYLDCERQNDGTMAVFLKRWDFPQNVHNCVIPATLHGAPVTSVSTGSSSVIPSCVRKIVIPASVTHIYLASPNSVEFEHYMESFQVDQENPVYWSDGYALYSKDRTILYRMVNYQAQEYTIQPGTRVVDRYAFFGMGNLRKLVFPDGLESVGENAFHRCSTLEEMINIEAVPCLTGRLLSGTLWYKNQSVIYLGTKLIKYTETEDTSFTVREGTTEIDYKAFAREINWQNPIKDHLEEIILPDSITFIGDDAFTTREQLKSIRLPRQLRNISNKLLLNLRQMPTLHIPASVEEIASNAFPVAYQPWGGPLIPCTLTAFDVAEENPHFKSMDGILYSKDGGVLVRVPAGYPKSELIVPEGVHTIGALAVHAVLALQSVILPDSVTTIEENAFSLCDNLSHASLGKVNTIGNNAFTNCRGLKSITLPQTLEYIGERAFEGCRIASVVIPKSVTAVGNYAFCHCSDITVYDTIDPEAKPAKQRTWKDISPTVGHIAHQHHSWNNHTITVRSGETDEIKFVLPMYAADGPSDYQSALLHSWGGHADFDFEKLDEAFPSIKGVPNKFKVAISRLRWPVDLPDKTRDAYASYLSKSAKDLVKRFVDSGDMDTLAFCTQFGILKKNNIDELIAYATKAKSVEFAAYLMGYKEENFAPKKGSRSPALSIKAVSIWTAPKAGTNKIGRYKGSDSIVEFPAEWNGITITGIASTTSKTPDNYLEIVEAILPEGYDSIGDYAFSGCTKLERITLPSTLQTIGRSAFAGCTSLKEIVLPPSVTAIGIAAFYGCISLAKVTLSPGMRFIPNDAFGNCKALTDLDLPAGISTLWKDAFTNGTQLQKLIVHGSYLGSDGAPFWNPPKVFAYAGASIKAFGIRKKDIQYMTIADQPADAEITLNIGQEKFTLAVPMLTGSIQNSCDPFEKMRKAHGLAKTLEEIYPGICLDACIEKLAAVEDFTLTEVKNHPDGKAETVFTCFGGKIALKTREILTGQKEDEIEFKDISGGGSAAPATDVQYAEVEAITFEGKIFVLSGFGATEESRISGVISAKGGEVKSSVVLKTDYLILNENYGGVTSKYNKAVELNRKGKNIIILSAARFDELA